MNEFFAAGVPQPQGSTKAFIRGGHAAITSDNVKLHSWRDVIGWAARQQHLDFIETGAVGVHLIFYLPKPKSARRDARPTKRPDLDKLIRGALDALTGIAWRDDSQVIQVVAQKTYSEEGKQPGVWVSLTLL